MSADALTDRPTGWRFDVPIHPTPLVDFQTALFTAEAVLDTAIGAYVSGNPDHLVLFIFGPSLFASVEPSFAVPGMFAVHYAKYPPAGMATIVARLLNTGYEDFSGALKR